MLDVGLQDNVTIKFDMIGEQTVLCFVHPITLGCRIVQCLHGELTQLYA